MTFLRGAFPLLVRRHAVILGAVLWAGHALAAPASLPPVLRLDPGADAFAVLALAEPIDGFIQVAPATGAAPTRRTELRLGQDGRALYIHVRAHDPEPAGIVAHQMRRDVEGMLSDDLVTLVIDPDGAGNNGFMFAVNAQGAQYDALVFDGGQIRNDWDARWQSEARIERDGWSARIVIPLSVFGRRLASAGQAPPLWRVNAERWMPRGSERVRLAGARPDKEVFSLGDALRMPAVTADLNGWGLRLKPSLRMTAESSAASGTGQARQRVAPGLELFHESEGGLRTSAALNIDFGEAEADERNVNLTRFELFQPERREFFLQDAGRFSFGGLAYSSLIPFYSRRIGLDASGHARGLDAGLKFSGHWQGLDFGLLSARVSGGPTAPGEPDQEAAGVSVMRVARPLSERHRAGFLATRGNPKGIGGSSLWGVDYQFRDTAWAGGRKTLEGHAWLQESTNAGLGTGRAWGGSVLYPNIGLNGNAEVQRIDAGFDPALGFMAESGVLRGKGEVGWWHRTPGGWNINPGIDWSFRRKLDDSERSVLINPEAGYTTPAGDTFMAEVFYESDRLAHGYAPLPGTWLAPGEYRWHHLYGYMETSPARPVSAVMELRSGGYYDGDRDDQVVQLAWKPGAHWGWRFVTARNAVRLPSGRFTLGTASVRLDHTPNTRLAQNLLVQWDNVTRALGFSARVRWTWAPGREVVAAVDRLGDTGEQRALQPVQTRAMVKLVWALER